MRTPRAIVVGGGVAGLAAAIDLSCGSGIETIVLEKEPAVGGKLRTVDIGGRAIDAGPTVLTMRWVLDELLGAAGVSADAVLRLARAQVIARHAWNEDETLDLFADRARAADAIGRFAGAGEARGFLAFCEHARRIFEAVELPFLRSQRPGAARLLRSLPALAAIDPARSLWRALGGFFRDARLRQLFGRYATYVGSSPFSAPATLAVIAHVEMDGVYLVEGGMIRLAQALEAAARARGVPIRCGAPVRELLVRSGRIAGVELADGERLEADAVVFNGEPSALGAGLLGEHVRSAAAVVRDRRRSLSAVTFLAAARTEWPLARHTVFFSPDYPRENAELFERRSLPGDPTVYVCAQDRADSGAREGGGEERVLVLVNAPAGCRPAAEEIEACRRRAMDRLRRCGAELAMGETRAVGPAEFARIFPGSAGALYGPASHGMSAAFLRPGSRTRIPGLYLAGGAVHPGPGVPMAMLSGRRAAEAIREDLRSTFASRPAVTRGGTSTASHRTAAGSRWSSSSAAPSRRTGSPRAATGPSIRSASAR